MVSEKARKILRETQKDLEEWFLKMDKLVYPQLANNGKEDVVLLNKKAVRQLVAECGKQTTREFIEALDRKVKAMVESAVAKARGFKRLTGAELL